MTIPFRTEMSFPDYEEQEIVRSTHFPEVGSLDRKALEDRRREIRGWRDKEKVFARQKPREASGKAAPRGGSFPGTASRPHQRKQIISAALKRLGREIHRRRAFDAKAALGEAARRALDLRRAQQFPHRREQATPSDGLRPLPSRRRHARLSRNKVGSVSQQNKRFQASRDGGASPLPRTS